MGLWLGRVLPRVAAGQGEKARLLSGLEVAAAEPHHGPREGWKAPPFLGFLPDPGPLCRRGMSPPDWSVRRSAAERSWSSAPRPSGPRPRGQREHRMLGS